MTSRTMPEQVLRELNRQESSELVLLFLTITNPELADPIRVVSDPRDFILDDNQFIGFQFNISPLSDNEEAPFSQLTIQNVDKRVGEGILLLSTPPRLKIEIISGTQFNLDDNPCTEKEGSGTAERIYSAPQLFLTEVDANVLEITGRIVSWDYTQEVWPGMMATQDRFPALFR